MFLSAKEIQSRSVARPTSKPNAGAHSSVTYATSVVKVKGRAPAKYFTLNIGGKIAKDAKLKIGDLVNLQFDPDSGMGLVVPYAEGWKLSGSAPNRQGLQVLRLRATWHAGLPTINGKGVCSQIEVKGVNTVQFKFPDATVFPKLKEKSGIDHVNNGATQAEQVASAQEKQKAADHREMAARRTVRFGRRATDVVLKVAQECGGA